MKDQTAGKCSQKLVLLKINHAWKTLITIVNKHKYGAVPALAAMFSPTLKAVPKYFKITL